MGASRSTLHAEQAIHFSELSRIEGGWAEFAATSAVSACSGGQSSQQGKTSEPAEERAQGAEIAAPVSCFKAFQGDNGQKKECREECQRVEGITEWQQVIPYQIVCRGHPVAFFTDQVVQCHPPLPGRKPQQGVEQKGKGTQQEGDRVQQAAEVEIEKRGKEQGEEQPVFGRTFQNFEGSTFGYPAGDQVENGSEGADPTAEKTPQQNGCHHHQ